MTDYLPELTPDLLVVGAGPAGLAAAVTAAQGGAQVLLLDSAPAPGGQIWRGAQASQSGAAGKWLRALQSHPQIEVLAGYSVSWVEHGPAGRSLLAQGSGGIRRIRPARIVLATGASEIFVPFPGWTRPGVVGAGGLQAMLKSGFGVKGKRVVVAGSGPLLLAVAATLRQKGAIVLAVAEQTSWRQLLRFGLNTAGKSSQAIGLLRDLVGVPYWANTFPLRADGPDQSHLGQPGTQPSTQLGSVTLQRQGREVTLDCDLLAVGFGLKPDLRVAQLLGCKVAGGLVQVDHWNQTSLPGIYAAGEITGMGGVDKAVAEGTWVGHVATGQAQHLRGTAPSIAFAPFVQALARDFALRPELRELPQADTIVCRCEDVCHGDLQAYDHWTQAKLQTRCGMGACQGRVCGPATEVLYGWTAGGIRPPLLPTPIAALLDDP